MADGIARRVERLIDYVRELGDTDDSVLTAMRAVPRHLFVPEVALAVPTRPDPARLIDRGADEEAWLEAVYSGVTIVTQLDDGATDIRAGKGDYTSSASAPRTVAHLLTQLAAEPGHRVLDVGTGTGWTAALLSRLVGAQHVTTVEVDGRVAGQAAKNLADVGLAVHQVVGDGADGCPARAPFDRVHVTCGIRHVPHAWVEQCRPGAVIVLPYCPDFGSNHLLRLTVRPDGSAVGRFVGFASYMLMRSQRSTPDAPARDAADRHWSTTRVDPRTVAHASAGADLAVSARTGLTSNTVNGQDDDGDWFRMWVSDPATPYSWAVAEWRPGRGEYDVYQVGDRPVWEEVCDAYFRWTGWGEPGRDRFGMTVTADRQEIWLDSPERVISSP
ncbi:methyltransferase domain-containing protein [Nonomuraea longicatena]|uniref:Protein-L-isoaspartate O-methyltransferase n=1 Tax=Nonomuraea longicatena TaxID=83682 RepID=A0ABN1R1G1_9ACTN